MPFKADLNELYAQTIKPTIERTRNLRCLRADEIYGPRPIMADIWKSIRQSKVIVAELTGRNPNVFYELGLAHAIQKPVILLSQNIDDIPFDLRHVRVIVYSNTEQGRKELQTKLRNTLRTFTEEFTASSSVESYAVLEAEKQPILPTDKSIGRLLRFLYGKDPSDTIKALESITSTFQEKRHPRNCDPRILAAILPHLESHFPEVQLNAIKALGAAGDAVHAQRLHSFLSSDNPVVVDTTIEALADIGDQSASTLLLDLFNNPTYRSSRIGILRAMAELYDEEAIPLLSKVVNDGNAGQSERKAALEILGKMQGWGVLDALLELDIDSLDVGLRVELAEAIMKAESPFRPQQIKRLETKLRRLVSDGSPAVRGRALAAWCLHSHEPFSGELDRSFLWDRIQRENTDALVEFFLGLGEYQSPFASDESSRLAGLAQKHPALLGDIVLSLSHFADKSVADFMIRTYHESDENQVWVLSYLSRIPSRDALRLLRAEVERDQDPSRVSLAAMALGRLGVKNMTDLILKRAFDSYPWIQAEARRYLEECQQHTSSSKKKEELSQAIARLALGSKGYTS
jgi:HEAT repeat protein